jgi:hypothetical protein
MPRPNPLATWLKKPHNLPTAVGADCFITQPMPVIGATAINDPDGFWAKAAEDCHWYKRWDKVLDDSNKPFYRWFTGGEINTCYNALDYHIDQGRGDQLALIYDSPVTDTIKVHLQPACGTKWPPLPACWPVRAWKRATGS